MYNFMQNNILHIAFYPTAAEAVIGPESDPLAAAKGRVEDGAES